jgi:GNAT superfamily N-acetyltransferase
MTVLEGAGTGYSIRPARNADADEIRRLAGELGYPVEAGEMAGRVAAVLADSKHQVLVAAGESGDRLLGWTHVEQRRSIAGGDHAEIMGMIIDPTARRLGIGAALVAAAEEWATARRLTTIEVRSNVVRDISHPFYEARGYARVKTQHSYEKSLPDRPAAGSSNTFHD